MKVPASGPRDARVMIVGEAPGRDEEIQLEPFVGASGVELTKMLHEAGFLRADCFITNVCKYRPPQNKIERFFGKKSEGLDAINGRYPRPQIVEGLAELEEEIREVKPELIIALGNTPLWALTGRWGITKWRGSILNSNLCWDSAQTAPYVVPTYHPAGVLRNWEWRFIAVHDLKKAYKLLNGEIKQPQYNFTIQPSFDHTLHILDELLDQVEKGSRHISVDIETRRRQIVCVGIAWDSTEAICIPLVDIRKENNSYWTADEELIITKKLRRLFTHPNVRVSGQNFAYDSQYFARQMGVLPRLWRDTMLIHHVCFAGLPKGLDFLSSFYLDWHEYWKDEGKEWNGKDEEKLWEYNCKDCVATWEIAEIQTDALRQLGFSSTDYGSPAEIQMATYGDMLDAMIRGVRIDTSLRKDYILILMDEIAKRQEWINRVLDREINVNSPAQLQQLFYKELQQRVILNRKTKKPTTDADALEQIAKREPLLGPLINRINEIRQLRNALALCNQPLDVDKRIRSSYNVAGTETYRLSSSKDAFGFGTNLQNITEGYHRADFSIPNLRRLFIPDPGCSMGDFDLKSADAQVVAAEAEEWDLLELLRTDFDLHTFNAKRWGISRPQAKACVHAGNYGVTPYGMARNIGIPQRLADDILMDWFRRYPGISRWQERVASDLSTRRYVENRFGYRRFYFDRVDNLLKEALAWIPQSTVGIVTNLGIRRVRQNVPQAQLLLQVHDSAVFQWRTEHTSEVVPQIQEQMRVPIPYSRPLTIEVGANVSTKSWGDCK